MSQSLTICEDDDEHGFNRTFNDFGNTSQYSVKQPLSLSMSMQTPASVSKRSSRLLSSIAKVCDSSSVVGSIFATENTSQTACKKEIFIWNSFIIRILLGYFRNYFENLKSP